LILFSAGLAVALEIKSRNLASKQPVVAPLEIPAPVVAETPAPAPATQIATTTKASTPKAAKPKLVTMPGYTPPLRVVVGKLISTTNEFTIRPGTTINAVVTVRAESGKPIYAAQDSYVEGNAPHGVSFTRSGYDQILQPSWTMNLRADSEAKPGIYSLRMSARGAPNGDGTYTRYETSDLKITVTTSQSFEIAATRLDDKTEPGYFAVRIKYSRIAGYSNTLPEPNITMTPDEESCELFDDGTDQYVFECDIEEPSQSYGITFSVTDFLGVTKSTHITITWP
ncbi:MAG: hypothetical protein Q8Q05_01425, partial [bacterium]|nr:hypothetical protein [bacterium]